MAQIKFEGLTNEWESFSSIIGTVDADTTYYIQNRGCDPLILLESDSEPGDGDFTGNIVLPNKVAVYKKGSQDLYLRAFNRSCSINVTSEA